MNPTQPAAIVAPAVAAKNIIAIWRESQEHSSHEHALYALARLNYGAHRREGEYDLNVGRPEFIEAALKKMARTFSPARDQRGFRTLMRTLSYYRADDWSGKSWGIEEREREEIKSLAYELYTEARTRGLDELLLLNPYPPIREKKPYTGPTSA